MFVHAHTWVWSLDFSPSSSYNSVQSSTSRNTAAKTVLFGFLSLNGEERIWTCFKQARILSEAWHQAHSNWRLPSSFHSKSMAAIYVSGKKNRSFFILYYLSTRGIGTWRDKQIFTSFATLGYSSSAGQTLNHQYITTDETYSETEELVIREEAKLRWNIRKSWLCSSLLTVKKKILFINSVTQMCT